MAETKEVVAGFLRLFRGRRNRWFKWDICPECGRGRWVEKDNHPKLCRHCQLNQIRALALQKQIIPLEERFWLKVDKTDGCWFWRGCRSGQGYGQIWLNGKMVPAHRIAWELTYGPIPKELFALHSCDNPICVNPDHLFIGTQTDNQQDSIRKDRFARGEKNGSAVLTRTQVREIRHSSLPQRKLARLYGVSRWTITDILRGRSWQWLK